MKMNSTPDQRLHAQVVGRVQGVGFRFTAKSIASRHKINGWVKNLSNGKVEIDAEGTSETIGDFMQELTAEMKRYITNIETEELSDSGGYEGFQIHF